MLDNWNIRKKITEIEFVIQEKEISVELVKKYLKNSVDIKYKEIFINGKKDIKGTLVFIEGLINTDIIDNYILKPLRQEQFEIKDEKELISEIINANVYHLAQQKVDILEEAIGNVLNGNIILIFDLEKACISFDVKGAEKRSVTEPTSENIIKGAKECFVELMRVNTSLIRKKIKTYDLNIEEEKIGSKSPTSVSIVYLESLVNKQILQELKKRIKDIKIENLTSLSIFEERIKDNKYSLFPELIYTELPDKACANIMDGRIVLIVDGYPTVYILPVCLPMFFQTPEDYSNNYIMGSFTRMLRYIALVVTSILPALYVAILMFHQDMIPTSLAESIIKSKENVPFTAFTETLLMLIAFEILIEAGIRMPKTIGQTVSIIGGLIVGQAAVSAKFLSPAVVVVIATAGISRISYA